MATNTDKPSDAAPAADTATAATAAAKRPAAKPAARPKAAKPVASAAPKPARKRAPASTKTASAAAKKPVARPTVRTSAATKKVAHEPAPFAAKGDKAEKPTKAKKAKLVRDSFTMPEPEYALIAALKKRCLHAGVSAKKSEILRAAVANLAKLGDSSVVAAVRRLEVIKTGRPAKGSK